MAASGSLKLVTMTALAAAGMFLGLAASRPEITAVGAAFLVAVVTGLSLTRTPQVEIGLTIGRDRCIEGDEVEIVATVSSDRICDVELGLALDSRMRTVEGRARTTLALTPGIEREHSWRLTAERWGAYRVGPLAVRVHSPGRLATFDHVHTERPQLKVFPRFDRVRRSFPPRDTQIYNGDYTARSAREGIEFASLRPFVYGDSVRRVNWRVTTRRGELHVNLSHPERDTDVALFLDAFTEVDLGHETTLDLIVRGASALADHHLRRNDRVGLLTFGGTLRWLTASMGRTHRYRVADFLLDVSATFSYAWKDIKLLPYGTLPANAVVIALSPLIDDRAITALNDIAARGFPLVIIDTLPVDRIPPSGEPEGEVAHRVWVMKRQMIRERFIDGGVPVVTWTGETGIEAALATLPRRDRTGVSLR
jgi:uncharacterized protein (DUF58 family)